MATDRIDAVVKGPVLPQREKAAAKAPNSGVSPAAAASDPLSSLPSSPPQIYLNLLILECSLRSQYLELRVRRRQHTFFLTLLFLWTAYFTYALFLAPREDGSVGGSVYWVIEMGEKVAFMGGIVTGILVWGTGQWERGVRWPRRWVGITNRGLRGFNLKIVVVKKSLLGEWMDTLQFFFDGGLWRGAESSNYRVIDSSLMHPEKSSRGSSELPTLREDDVGLGGQQEDLSKGGDTIALLLLPKPFSSTFRENWDLYRTEYWEKENARRAALLDKVKSHDKAILKKARQELSWSQWLFSWRKPSSGDLEKLAHHHHNQTHLKSGEKRLRSGSGSISGRSGSHSRNSSRTSTPILEPADGESNITRRSSNASNASTVTDKRKKRSSALLNRTGSTSSSGSAGPAKLSKLTAARTDMNGSLPGTPANDADEKKLPGSPLVRQSSFASVSSLEMEKDDTEGKDKNADSKIKVEEAV